MTDKELIDGCLRGKRSAQDELYRRYAGKLFAVCLRFTRNRMDAEDLLQEGFVKIFKKIDTVRRDQEAALYPWMRRVFVNLTLNYLRDEKKYRFTEDISGMEYQLSDEKEESSAPLFEHVSPLEITKIISNLPDGYRTVFNLYAFEGYSHQDIADALGISVNTSKTQLMKARRQIALALEKKIKNKPQLKLVI